MNTWVSGSLVQHTYQLSRVYFISLSIYICISLAFVAGCSGPVDSDTRAGPLQIDGKPLDLTSASMVLDAGVHIISGGSESVKYSGTISGPGMLRVVLNKNSTLVLDGVLTHGDTTVESGTVDLTKAIERSGKFHVTNSGIVKRLANPTDISSSLRLWVDSKRTWSILRDNYNVNPVDTINQNIAQWMSLDNWKSYIPKTLNGDQTKFQGEDAGVGIDAGNFSVMNLDIRSEFTVAAVYQPLSVDGANPGCLVTAWGSNTSEFSVCYWTTTDPNTRDLKVGWYKGGVWTYSSSFLINTTVDGSTKKFPIEASVDTILTAIGNKSGTELKVNGLQVSTGSIPFVSNDNIDFEYNFGGSWAYEWSLNMNLRELIITSDSQFVEALTGYLAWRNGLQAKLPGNHPYKLSPPTAVIDKSGSSVYRSCDGDKTCLVTFQSACAPRCLISDRCGNNGDCQSRNCINGKCEAAVCTFNCKNGTSCSAASGCASLNCKDNVCQSCAPNCTKGAVCAISADCASLRCLDNLCQAVACTPNCYTAEKCDANSDCLSAVCINGSCGPPVGSPNIGRGEKCVDNSNCFSSVCNNKVCADPACSPYCMEGARCYNNGNCLSGACATSTTKLCTAINCTPSCAAGEKCAQNNDCSSKSCVNNFCR